MIALLMILYVALVVSMAVPPLLLITIPATILFTLKVARRRREILDARNHLVTMSGINAAGKVFGS